jgi:hypothetical protein
MMDPEEIRVQQVLLVPLDLMVRLVQQVLLVPLDLMVRLVQQVLLVPLDLMVRPWVIPQVTLLLWVLQLETSGTKMTLVCIMQMYLTELL